MQTTVEILREDLPRTAERGTAETLQGNTAPLNHAKYLTSLQGLDAVRPCEPTGTRPQSEMVPGGLAAWFGVGRDAAGARCGRSPARRDDGRRPTPRPLADDALEWRFCHRVPGGQGLNLLAPNRGSKCASAWRLQALADIGPSVLRWGDSRASALLWTAAVEIRGPGVGSGSVSDPRPDPRRASAHNFYGKLHPM